MSTAVSSSSASTLIRKWRARLEPSSTGLPAGRGRRATGLRREELAVLAGISVDYLVRLEQGRSENPSPQVLAALAAALHLSEDERGELFAATGRVEDVGDAVIPRVVPPSTRRMMARVPDVAIGVYAFDWTLLDANALWRSIFIGPSDDNLAVATFIGPQALPVARDERETAEFEAGLVSDLLVASRRYPGDGALAGLIERLRRDARFARLWELGAITRRGAGPKRFVHPAVGEMVLDCDVYAAAGYDARVVMYDAEAGSEHAARLQALIAASPGS